MLIQLSAYEIRILLVAPRGKSSLDVEITVFKLVSVGLRTMWLRDFYLDPCVYIPRLWLSAQATNVKLVKIIFFKPVSTKSTEDKLDRKTVTH